MGILEILPQGLVTLLTWLMLFLAASFVVLLLAVLVGPMFGDILDRLTRWLR